MAGPHGRLGVAWAVVTVGATAAGAVWLALWLGVNAGLAGAQVARSRDSASLVILAGGGAAGVTLAAAAGPVAVAVAAGLVSAVAAAYALVGRSAHHRTPMETLAVSGAAVMVGLAAAAPVLLRAGDGLVPVLVLFAYAMAYDAGTYVVGSGAASAWEGPAAGIAATGTVTLMVAALFASPFHGASPWLLGLLAATLAPIGPMVGLAFTGARSDRKVRVPALRRLDSLLVLGPVWSIVAVLLMG